MDDLITVVNPIYEIIRFERPYEGVLIGQKVWLADGREALFIAWEGEGLAKVQVPRTKRDEMKMKLSDVRHGGVIHIEGKLAIVAHRYPPDRVGGLTVVHYDSGEREDFLWDHNDPEITYKGQGRLITRIEMDWQEGKNS